jgi:hypothetical protein
MTDYSHISKVAMVIQFYLIPGIILILTLTKFITSALLFFFLPLLASVLPAPKRNKNVSI